MAGGWLSPRDAGAPSLLSSWVPLLAATNLHVAYGHKIILDGVSISIDAGQRVGIVGKNGGGKSTLMKCLSGIIKPDIGEISLAKGCRAGYLHQDPVLDLHETLRGEAEAAFEHLHSLHKQLDDLYHEMADAQGDALDKLLAKQVKLDEQMQAAGGYAIDHKIEAVLHGLGFTDSQFNVPVSGLSGGQKGRLALAKLLLQEPDILLLDEPTNHLDIEGRLWLEDFLVNQFRGAVLLISHDRYLLDNVVHRIIEVEHNRLIDYPGNYQAFVEIRAQRRLSQMRAFENQQTKFKSEEAYIRRYRAGQRAKQAQGRLSKLTRAKEDALERPIELAGFRLELPKAPRAGDLVVVARGISKAYPTHTGQSKDLFSNLDVIVGRGERWGIIGPNGAGKSTIVRIMLGEQPPDTGTIKLGSNVVLGHYKQTHEHLDLDKTVVEYLQHVILKECPGSTLSEQAARNLAGAFLFSGDEQERDLRSLSGGERSRAVLAGLLASAKNLLVLDEPTNHLDISSAERLEDALEKPDEETGQDGFEGTLILISHDRALIDATCDHLLILDGKGGAEVFTGSWSDWQIKLAERAKAATQKDNQERARKEKAEAQAQAQRKAAEQKAQEKKAPAVEVRPSKPNLPRSKSRFGKLRTDQIEARMSELQAELARMDEQLADPSFWKDRNKGRDLAELRDQRKAELDEIEAEWLARQ